MLVKLPDNTWVEHTEFRKATPVMKNDMTGKLFYSEIDMVTTTYRLKVVFEAKSIEEAQKKMDDAMDGVNACYEMYLPPLPPEEK